MLPLDHLTPNTSGVAAAKSLSAPYQSKSAQNQFDMLKGIVESTSFKLTYKNNPEKAQKILEKFIDQSKEIKDFKNKFPVLNKAQPEDVIFEYFLTKGKFVHIEHLKKEKGFAVLTDLKQKDIPISRESLFKLKNIFDLEKIPEHAQYNTIDEPDFLFVGFTMGPEQLFTNISRLKSSHELMSSISNQLGDAWPKISLDQAAESTSLHEFIHAGINEKQLQIFNKPNEYNWQKIESEIPGLKIQNNIQVDEMIAFSFSFADNINTIIPELHDNHVDNLNDPKANYALKANFLNQILIKALNRKGLDGQKIMIEFKNKMEKADTVQKKILVVNLLRQLNKKEDIVFVQHEFQRVAKVLLDEIRRVKSKVN